MTLSMMRIEAANASRRWRSENDDVREIVGGAPAAENLEEAQPLSSRNNNSATQQQLRSSPINERLPTTTNNNSNNENDGSNTNTNGSNSSNCNDESLPNLQHSIDDDDTNNNSNSSTIDFDSKIQQLFQNIQNETRQIFKAHEQRDTDETNNICLFHRQNNNNNIPTNDDGRKRRSSILDNIIHSGRSDDDTPKRIKSLPLATVAGVSAKVSDSNDVSFENEDREMEEDSSLDFFGSANNNDYDDMDFDESDKENDSTPTELQAASTIGFTIGLTAAAAPPSPQQYQKQQHDENDSIDWGTTTDGGMDSDEESEDEIRGKRNEDDDMDVDHVDFTGGSGGGGDVDMTDESDDTSSTPQVTTRRCSPRLAPDNNEASSLTSAQTQSGDTASTTDDSVVTLNGRTLPHVRKVARLPSPHNHESYGNHPQLREHKDCLGDICTRGSCILRRMIPRMKPGGDLDYNYDEERIDVTRFTRQLLELGCPLVAGVLEKVNELDYPTSKPKPTNKKSKTIVRREDTYTGPQMNAMEGTIIMGCSIIRLGQDGYDTVLNILSEYEDEWAVCTRSREEEILREMYDRTIRLDFVWNRARKVTNGRRRGNLYELEAVTEFSNNINLHPNLDSGSPRQSLFGRMHRHDDQKEAADAKKENEKKAESEMKAMIERIERAHSLFGGNCLSDPKFDIHKKISEADIARAEREIEEVEAMQTVIPPASDSTKDIIHVPTVYILVAFALLFEFFLKMEADKKPCTFKKLCDTIEEHTGLELSNITHKGLYDSYEEHWRKDWKGMLGDIAVYLPLLLAGKSASYDCPLGMTWMDLHNSEWDHLTNLFVKFMGVGYMQKNGSSLLDVLVEMCKCAGIDKSTHERGDRTDHDLKLRYEPVLRYDFGRAGEDGAGIISADHFFNSKEILKLRFVLWKNDLLNKKGSGLPPKVSLSAIKAMVWFTTSVVLSDIHPKTDDEWQAQLSEHRNTINQMLLYLYKSMSKNPNPNGQRLADIIPIRKSGVDLHHPIVYEYDVGPSDLTKKPTDYMISELIKGKCIPLISGDHHIVTGYEKEWWKDIPEWLKKLSRFQYNY